MTVDYHGQPLTESSIGVTVRVVGLQSKSEEWEMSSGGANTAQLSKVRIGTDPDRTVVLPSVRDSSDVTFTRNMVMPDVWNLYQALNNLVGRATVKAWMNPLDSDGVPISQASGSGVSAQSLNGILASVTPPQASNESTTVATISITVTGSGWQSTS